MEDGVAVARASPRPAITLRLFGLSHRVGSERWPFCFRGPSDASDATLFSMPLHRTQMRRDVVWATG